MNIFKIVNHVTAINLPTIAGMGNKYREFDVMIVPDWDSTKQSFPWFVARPTSPDFGSGNTTTGGITYIGDGAGQSTNNLSGTTTISGGQVTSLTLTAGQSNYGWDLKTDNYHPTETVVVIQAPASGTRATARAVIRDGKIVGFEITNSGSGYTVSPTFTLGKQTRYAIDENGAVIWLRITYVPAAMSNFKSRWFVQKIASTNYLYSPVFTTTYVPWETPNNNGY
jgi:hypothetical protein